MYSYLVSVIYTRECNSLWGEPERAIEVCCRLSSTVEDSALGHSHTIRTRRSLYCSLHLANLHALCSGISLALALDPHSLSCVLSAWSIVLSCCVGVVRNVITSHQFTRLYGWRMCMMPCGHVPNARSHEITIHITTVGLAQACPNNYIHTFFSFCSDLAVDLLYYMLKMLMCGLNVIGYLRLVSLDLRCISPSCSFFLWYNF